MQVMKLFSAMHLSEFTLPALCMFCKDMLSVNASTPKFAPDSSCSVSTVVHDVYAKSNMIKDA
jgi:hypothetical protein